MLNPIPYTVCPYLGLDLDRTVMLDEPTPAHRCYRPIPADSPDLECQRAFCLSTAHVTCAIFQRTQPQPAPAARPPAKEATPARAAAHPLPPRAATAPRSSREMKAPPGRLGRWPPLLTLVSIALTLLLFLIALVVNRLELPATAGTAWPPQPVVVATPAGVRFAAQTRRIALAVATPAPTPTASVSVGALTPAALPGQRFATPTAEPGGQVFLLGPSTGNAGWWKEQDQQRNHLGDSYLYAGAYQDETFIAAVQFNIAKIPRGAAIQQVRLRLTGIRQDQLQAAAKGVWLVQLVPESSLAKLNTADFLTMLSAPAAMTLPPLTITDLAADQVNEWEWDKPTRRWLEQELLAGATAVTVRIQAAIEAGEALFAWDSGLGPESKGAAPALLISIGPPPPTPPPLPTKPLVVATLTPVPKNVLTVVALANTATAIAVTTGTYTPVPYAIVTPTPFPANLETVQAVAIAQELPAVILHTPTPSNAAGATRQAAYATAVALTTGTFTPMPTLYVTPILIIPSPPPENVATEAARVAAASANSGAPTATPLPYNAVMAEYIYATPVPANEATAIADAVIATASAMVNGAPTPLRWNHIIITAVPTPTGLPSPTATPLPLIQSVTEFTPTPTVIDLAHAPDTLPENLRHKIIFKTNRSGIEEVYALDPATSELYRINEAWVYPLAQQQMGFAPDHTQKAIVQAAADGTLQIHIFSAIYGTTHQVTALGSNSGRATINYDPDWSPQGDRLVFVSTNSGNDEIYTVTIDGNIVQQLTTNQFEWDKHPCWSPDGTQIVFFSNREAGRRQLWIMNADGTAQRNLSNNAYEDWDPIWTR